MTHAHAIAVQWIERVAKAIFDCSGYDDAVNFVLEDWAPAARAAIAATRDPTPEMIEAGAKIMGDESGADRWNALCCWHAMHAEMLK